MLPKRLSTGVRYLNASQYNTPVTITDPNAGQAADGTPLAEVVIATTHANISRWRDREADKAQARSSQGYYKIVIRYHKTYSLHTGMNILVRNQRHLIDGFLDEDGQMIQLSISTWVENDTVCQ